MNYFTAELEQDRHSLSAEEYLDFYYHNSKDCVAQDYLDFYQTAKIEQDLSAEEYLDYYQSPASDPEYNLEAEVQALLRSSYIESMLGF